MFSYTVTFSHPEIDEEDLRAFLEHEFSLWDLSVTRSEGSGKVAAGAFQVTFQHPWLEPATMFGFLEREYAPSDLSVTRDGAAALSFTGSRSDDETPQKRGLARKTESLRRAILQLFDGPAIVDADRLATVTGARTPSSVQNAIKSLIADGQIRRLAPGRFIAADQPDPEPALPARKPPKARRASRIVPDTLAELDAALLKRLEEAPAGTLASLEAVGNGRAKPTIHKALQRLTEQGKVRRTDRGVYVAKDKPDPTAEEVAELRSRREKGEASAPAPKARKSRATKAETADTTAAGSDDGLLEFLAEPRSLPEICARLELARTAALRRMGEMESAGQVHRRRVGLRHLYGSDPARLAAVASGPEETLRPAEWKVLQVMPLAGRLRLPPLAKAAGMNSGETLAAARKMQGRGLLDLRQEGRAWLLSLTEAGIEATDLEEGRGKARRLAPEEDLFTAAAKGDLDAA